jgi:hypothetical protein
VNADRYLIFHQSEGVGEALVVNLSHVLNLGKVVSRAQSPHLRAPALYRSPTDLAGIGLADTPVVLDVIEIGLRPEPVGDSPARSIGEHPANLLFRELEVPPVRADSRGHIGKECLDELAELWLDFLATQT